MAERDTTRRLAAIMAVDVAGYSRLMNADEDGTHAQVTACIEGIVRPAIAEHKGRAVKFTGDGLLAEFPSAVEAVRSAVDIQTAMAARENDAGGERRVQFRIGVNLGDIIIDEDDIYGDGVNVAARIEGLCDPGGIFLARSIAEQISAKLDIGLEDLGKHQVKNIPQPVHVFRVLFDGAALGKLAAASGAGVSLRTWMALAAVLIGVIAIAVLMRPWEGEEAQDPAAVTAEVVATKPTIAVLPFNNFSDDKNQEYFSDGLTEDLITDISKISGLSVIARNSTFAYKGRAPDVRSVGAELGATHVIEGSVRKAGNTVRITVQLLDARDGTHIWADRYDRELKDIFAIQDEVIGHIIGSLALKLTPEEAKRVAKRGTDNPEAYDLFMRGREQEGFFNKDAYVEAKRYYERAIALDPNYVEAIAHLAQIYSLEAQFGWVDDVGAGWQRAARSLRHALAIDDENTYALFSMGRIIPRSGGTIEEAIDGLEKAVKLDPNYADAHAYLTFLYVGSGHPNKGLASVERAMKLNPLFPYWYWHAHAVVNFAKERYAEAAADLEKALERNPTVPFLQYWYAASLAMAGRIGDAEWMVEEMYGQGFGLTLEEMTSNNVVLRPEYRERFIEGLKKAGFK